MSTVISSDYAPLEGASTFVRTWDSRYRFVTHLVGQSMTQQSHAISCDINRIIERYDRTGSLPVSDKKPSYGDFTSFQGDLTERITRSEQAISATKAHFRNKNKTKHDEADTATPAPSDPPAPSPSE